MEPMGAAGFEPAKYETPRLQLGCFGPLAYTPFKYSFKPFLQDASLMLPFFVLWSSVVLENIEGCIQKIFHHLFLTHSNDPRVGVSPNETMVMTSTAHHISPPFDQQLCFLPSPLYFGISALHQRVTLTMRGSQSDSEHLASSPSPRHCEPP